MPKFNKPEARGIPSLMLAALAALLCACATGQDGNSRPAAPASVATNSPSASFSTGRLVVYITDQNGRNVDRATVDVTGEGGYRATGVTSRNGNVSFSGVPQVVNVSVSHPGGSYSRPFAVASSGSSDMRIIMDIQEFEAPQAPDDAGGGTAPGRPGGF